MSWWTKRLFIRGKKGKSYPFRMNHLIFALSQYLFSTINSYKNKNKHKIGMFSKEKQ